MKKKRKKKKQSQLICCHVGHVASRGRISPTVFYRDTRKTTTRDNACEPRNFQRVSSVIRATHSLILLHSWRAAGNKAVLTHDRRRRYVPAVRETRKFLRSSDVKTEFAELTGCPAGAAYRGAGGRGSGIRRSKGSRIVDGFTFAAKDCPYLALVAICPWPLMSGMGLVPKKAGRRTLREVSAAASGFTHANPAIV